MIEQTTKIVTIKEEDTFNLLLSYAEESGVVIDIGHSEQCFIIEKEEVELFTSILILRDIDFSVS